MKQITYFSSIILIALFMASCTNGQNKTTDGGIAKNVKVEEFSTHLGDAQILDVRTPAEWNEGIIEGAVLNNIYEAGFEQQLQKLDKEKPVAVYCAVGGRSGQAMDKMKQLGFKEVYNLNGGMDAWKGADKPTVKP